jgi:hypothetical protein
LAPRPKTGVAERLEFQAQIGACAHFYTDRKNRLLKAAAPELYQPYQL